MNIIINNEKMEVAASAQSLEQAICLAEILCKTQDFCVVGHRVKHYSIYTEMELTLLLKSVGVEVGGHLDRKDLVGKLIASCENMPVDETPLAELRQRLGLASDEMPAIDFSQPKPQPTPSKVSGTAPTAINRPKAGTATGMVWDIVDSLLEWDELPQKSAVLEAGVKAGLNEATISTQFSKYRRWFLEQKN